MLNTLHHLVFFFLAVYRGYFDVNAFLWFKLFERCTNDHQNMIIKKLFKKYSVIKFTIINQLFQTVYFKSNTYSLT